MLVRRDAQFSDVKDRPKHHHCRCQECANLQARRLTAFNSPYEKEQYKLEWQDHHNEKRLWREFEKCLVDSARHDPRELNVFWYDDTEKTGFPKFTKRPMKNLPVARMNLIPFLIADLARQRDFYIYMHGGRFKKGANRLCTALLTAFRATKNGTDMARYARKLALIADNYSENKNNILLAFATQLVMMGWYDEITFAYGPTGHTHNGGDQQHQIHNEILGNFTSPTFVHFLARFPQAWRTEKSRPTPSLLDVQYDWGAYYKSYLNPIAGHTNTAGDPVGIRGFRVARGGGGVVSAQWKTKAESGEWRGADGQVGTQGFVVLKGLPRGKPGLIEPKRNVMEEKYYKQLIGTKMRECLEAAGAPEAIPWLAKGAKHGVVPIHQRLQEPGIITPGEFGSEVELKCGEAKAVVQVIEDYEQTADAFWALPAEVLRDRADGEARAEVLSARHRLHPAVGYARVPVTGRPTYEGSAAQAMARSEENKGKEMDVGDNSEDGDQNALILRRPILERSAAQAKSRREESRETDGDSASSDGDDSEDNDDDRPIRVSNASRHNVAAEQRQDKAKKRRLEVEDQRPEVVEEKKMDVCAVFGKGFVDPEVWFGVRVSCTNDKVRIQFLEPVEGEPGMYLLTKQCATYRPNMIEHTFENTIFVSTTTYKLTKKTKRHQKSSKEVKTVTKSPLDANTLNRLSIECGEEADDEL
jgi:hypothetical protein